MCTSIIVGNGATEHGLVILARNEEFTTNNWDKLLKYREQPEYEPRENNLVVENGNWTLGNGLKVPVPENSFSYTAMPDAEGYQEVKYAIGEHFCFEARGINERNVAISATNTMQIKAKAQNADRLVDVGICEPIIPSLILPQAESARHAVKCLGGYIEHFGASDEGAGVLIGDPDESWYLEIGSGHHWIAVRVPDDAYLAVANSMRIHSVDIDSDEVLHSPGLFEFVEEHGLLEKPDRHNFNFAKAFGILGGDPEDKHDIGYNVDRIWLAQKILTPSLAQKPRQPQYPLFLKPDRKIGVKDVMTVMRANYKGTELESANPPPTRPIGIDRTAESHIISFNPKLPNKLKGVIWQALGTPLGSPYMPLFNVMDFIPSVYDIPSGYVMGGSQYNPLSAYWSFRGLYALAQANGEEHLPEIQKMWGQMESQFIDEYAYICEMLIKLEQSDDHMAVNFAKHYSSGIASQMVERANAKRNDIMTALTKRTEKH
jgi:dipeptidase